MFQQLKAITMIIVTLHLSGCGLIIDTVSSSFPKESEPEDSNKPTPYRRSLTASHSTPDTALVVKIEKHLRWQVRVACDGSTERVKVSVKEPMNYIRLLPEKARGELIVDSDIYNETTDDWRECAMNVCPKNDFDVHTSKYGAQALHVDRSKVNRIEYRLEWETGFEEEGVRYIEIEYSEKTLDGDHVLCVCADGC